MTRVKVAAQKQRRGAEVVETALVLNVVLLGLLSIFEYGRLVMVRQLLNNAAREGSRYAVVGSAETPHVTTEQIRETVRSYLAGQSIDITDIKVYQANPSTGDWVSDAWAQTPYGGAIAVQVEAMYRPILPTTLGIIPNPFPVTGISMMLSEAN
jgi:Flp pilus assembly protein TadG